MSGKDGLASEAAVKELHDIGECTPSVCPYCTPERKGDVMNVQLIVEIIAERERLAKIVDDLIKAAGGPDSLENLSTVIARAKKERKC